MQEKKKYRRGFTLAELLVVVAIIAILVCVSIPIFSWQANKAKETTCAANRNILKRELSVKYMTDGTFQNQTTMKRKRIELPEQKTANLCPEHGTITAYLDVENSAVDVYCDKHAPYGVTLGDNNVQSLLVDAFQTIQSKVNELDYGALSNPNSKASEVMRALEERGIKMSDIKINGDSVTAWCAANVGAGQANQLYFTACNISNVTAGTKVPVIMYTGSTKTFRVYDVAVKSATNSNGDAYNTLDRTNMTTLKWNPANYKEAENAYLSSSFFE